MRRIVRRGNHGKKGYDGNRDWVLLCKCRDCNHARDIHRKKWSNLGRILRRAKT